MNLQSATKLLIPIHPAGEEMDALVLLEVLGCSG